MTKRTGSTRWREPAQHAAAVGKGYPPAQARVKERERQAGQKNKIRVIRLQQNSKNNNQAGKGVGRGEAQGDIRKGTNSEPGLRFLQD